MTEDMLISDKRKFDIHQRIFKFVVDVLSCIKYVPKTQANLTVVNQIIRSSTSVGANDQEADGVSTKPDFIHCYTVVRKELKETLYWLTLLIALHPQLNNTFQNTLQENRELILIVSSIIPNTVRK
jgi:four helix bundle protein